MHTMRWAVPFALTLCSCAMLVAGCDDDKDSASGERVTPPLPESYRPQGDEFMVVYIPDSQIYAESFPETFISQTRWVAEYAEEYRIVFVSHVGDIVNTGDSDIQWSNARAAYDWLDDIDMPQGYSFASHDETRTGDRICTDLENPRCRATKYLQHFGPDRYTGKSWFGGASPSGVSNYQIVEASGMRLIFMHLPQDPPLAEVEWAGEVLDANPGTLAQFITHRYLYDYRLTDWLPFPLSLLQSGRFNSIVYHLGGQELKYATSLEVSDLFDELVLNRPNIWSIHCGHVDGELNQQWDNAAGLPVYENLIDFQDMADGGGGWLRVLRYRPALNEVQAITFSTTTGKVRENGEGFDHSIAILEYYKNEYAADLAQFGLDEAQIDALLESVKREGPDREAYRSSLYDGGMRQSVYTMPVNFQAYIDASR